MSAPLNVELCTHRNTELVLSKKLRKAFTRALIDLQQIGKPFSKTDISVLNYLVGIDAHQAVRKPNPEYPNDTRHLHIDGRSFSWVRSIEGYDDLQKLKKTMRNIISSDLQDFMSAIEPFECANCGSVTDLTCDHANIPFDVIATNFIAEHAQIEVEPKSNGVGDRFVSLDMESEWISYHASHAEYQVLCRSCNSSKGSRVK